MLVERQIDTYYVSIYVYSGVVRFITDYVTGGYIFALFDRLYQSTNFFLNLLSYMLTYYCVLDLTHWMVPRYYVGVTTYHNKSLDKLLVPRFAVLSIES